MNHLDFDITPVQYLNYFSNKWDINLWCKRDDLFIKAGGGSKARMLQYIFYPLVKDKIETFITAGGPCSNYNRAAALTCAELGLKMKLVSYTDNPSEYATSLNYFLTRLAGVEFIYCDKMDVPLVIKEVVNKSQSIGENSRYLYGGGKSLEGVYAYYDAVKELRRQFTGDLDAVFVACGTGTTLTGICAGMQEYFPRTIIHGISVARSYADEKKVLDENMENLNIYLGSDYNFSNLKFHDEYILGGYGNTSSEELQVICECISNQGILVDPTYSGKAFYGMSKILSHQKNHNSSVLFWNTGGNINLLSQRELFEYGNHSLTE